MRRPGSSWFRAGCHVFHAARQFVETRFGRIAYVEQGNGPVAPFLHGLPLNGFQWRGVMARLSDRRRCIAPDFLGLGYTETRPGQDLAPRAQADMIVAVLDALSFDAVDSVANNSGGAVAQLLTARYPKRVRTLLLTNCDVHTNSPPKAMAPELEAARKGTLANLLARQIRDKAFARSAEGLGGQYVLAFEPNPLPAIEPALKACAVPVRMVWGTGDRYFDPSWADWLDRTLPRSRGVRRVQGAKLFFPEEMPELIAEEESALWEVRP